MKHFIKKKTFAGAGGKDRPKPKATVLRPPDIGNFEVASSYSVAEMVDLLSDGPIEGLVNQNGQNVTNDSLLQGVYLNNTPIEITSAVVEGASAAALSNKLYDFTPASNNAFRDRSEYVTNRLKGTRFGIFKDDNITRCFFNYEAGGAYDRLRRFAGNSFPWFMSDNQRVFKVFATESNNDNGGKVLQPIFRLFSDPQYWDGGNVLPSTLANTYNGRENYHQEISVCKHSLFIKNRNATQNKQYLLGDNNQKAHSSFVEVHYMNETLNLEHNITLDFFLYLASLQNDPNSSTVTKALATHTINRINNFWKTPLGQNLYTRKFGEGSPQGPDKQKPANFSNSSFSVNNRPSDKFFIIVKVGDDNWGSDASKYATATKRGNISNSIYAAGTETIDTFNIKITHDTFTFPPEIKIHNFVIPKLCNGPGAATYPGPFDEMCGLFYGFIVLEIPLRQELGGRINDLKIWNGNTGKVAMWNGTSARFRSFQTQRWFYNEGPSLIGNKYWRLTFVRGNGEDEQPTNSSNAKYNFSNVLCEFKTGDEFQKPLKYFNNIYIDYEYNAALYGATRYGTEKTIRVIQQDAELKGNTSKGPAWNELTAQQFGGLVRLNSEGSNAAKETSSDVRKVKEDKTKNYSDWNKDSRFNESESPIIHTIENPNVTSVYFTLGVSSLKDTIHVTQGSDGVLEAGDSIPAILTIQVSWGMINNGVMTQSGLENFTIIAQIESLTLIDFGMPESGAGNSNLDYVLRGEPDHVDDKKMRSANKKITFPLPLINEKDDASGKKRFIKISKVSVETNSVLISRDCSLIKVTEIINSNLSYPFSAVSGLKLDSRSFGSVPDRSFDCRLKRVKIPSNYVPLNTNGTDKRYIKSASTYTDPIKIYNKDWDGLFAEGWTDNPAWILYDLLTSTRYGLGGYIDESQINIWELYKIGRFCDNVNDEGYFIGVSDGVGGLEPRYSCNILFKDNIKVFDAINIVSNLFRGATFFSNSEIHFLDDRPRNPIAFFSNTNVKDGFFSYANNRKDQQFNTVEVVYLDRFDNFKTKVEFVEDEANIRKRGVLKTTINTNGVTSRAMARRIGKHIIYQTINENQSVEFRAGLESLLCRPGDLIVVEDEMKTRETNYGKVLSINLDEKSLYVENQFSAKNYTGKLTVYTPTGYTTNDELLEIANYDRSRIEYFDFVNDSPIVDATFSKIVGTYSFDKYTDGYTGSEAPQYFAMYTGFNSTNQQNLFCYYNTGASGWVFSTGKAFSDNDLYDQVITSTGVYRIEEINASIDGNPTGFLYSSAASNKRGLATSNLDNNIVGVDKERISNGGILNSEISTINYPQIKTFNITGFDNQDYGCNLYLNTGDPSINLLQFVKVGSPYRIERIGATDQIYKILSIREENQNEYNVVASKYDTGKYELIENFTAEDYLPDTYYAGSIKVSNYEINQLEVPYIDKFDITNSSESSFSLSGVWRLITKATGYEVNVYNSLAQNSQTYFMPTNVTKYEFKDLGNLGTWTLKVKALGDNNNLDSDYSSKDRFVLYQGITTFDRPAVSNFTIL